MLAPYVASGQTLSVLHIRIVLMDAEQKPVPVARHALLISDNPATTAPRRIVTALDGTADVRLRPGNYTVESDQPVAFQRKAYQWTQTLDIAAGGDTVLELSADNAEIGPVTAATAAAYKAPVDTDPAVLLTPWQDSVVTLWTQTTRASGFVVDARGLAATSQRAVGNDTSIEVQITPTLKVAGRVVVADPGAGRRDCPNRSRDSGRDSHALVRVPRLGEITSGRTGTLRLRRTARSAEKALPLATSAPWIHTRSRSTSGSPTPVPAGRCFRPQVTSWGLSPHWTTRRRVGGGVSALSTSRAGAVCLRRRRRKWPMPRHRTEHTFPSNRCCRFRSTR